MNELLPVREARSRILAGFQTLPAEQCPIDQLRGRVLAESIISSVDLPPFSNSSMDGFAIQAADTVSATPSSPGILNVIGDIPAGTHPAFEIHPGEAARIMTGAAVPAGADAVIQVEDTDFNFREASTPPERIQLYRPVKPGENIRQAGMDITRGQAVLESGRILLPQDIALLASLGIARISVIRQPRVAVLSTGDELVELHEELLPGKIREANSYFLTGLVEEDGGIPIRLGIACDTPESVREKLDQAIEQGADVILTSAGVSVGAYDFVRSVIQEHGVIDFWKVNMRPGKPLAFGSYRGVPIFGLPGNPVSSFTNYLIFVRPALNILCGRKSDPLQPGIAEIDEDIDSDGRESYLRAIIYIKGGKMHASLTGHQGSGNLHSLVRANALLIVPSGVKSLPAGSNCEFWYL